MNRLPRIHLPLLIMALGLLPCQGGCTLIYYGVLKNETGDTLHLSATGIDHELLGMHPEYLCGCPLTIDTLHRTAEIDIPPDSAVVIGLRGHYTYSDSIRRAPYDGRMPTFKSLRITGPDYDRSFNDSTITLLPHTTTGRRDTFRLRRDP